MCLQGDQPKHKINEVLSECIQGSRNESNPLLSHSDVVVQFPRIHQCGGDVHFGALSFLVGGVICLVSSVNERDLDISLLRRALAPTSLAHLWQQ